jgi:RES domain-containing protein
LILRLDDASVRSHLGLTVAQFNGEPWRKLQESGQEALTQAVGRACWTLRFEGLIVPSAHGLEDVNLVVFPDFVPADRMRILAG